MGLKLDSSTALECSVFRNAVYLLPVYKLISFFKSCVL